MEPLYSFSGVSLRELLSVMYFYVKFICFKFIFNILDIYVLQCHHLRDDQVFFYTIGKVFFHGILYENISFVDDTVAFLQVVSL